MWIRRRDSSVGIATGYGLALQKFSSLIVQTGSGTYPASYTLGAGKDMLGGKAAVA
jgi:hypothetical protein